MSFSLDVNNVHTIFWHKMYVHTYTSREWIFLFCFFVCCEMRKNCIHSISALHPFISSEQFLSPVFSPYDSINQDKADKKNASYQMGSLTRMKIVWPKERKRKVEACSTQKSICNPRSWRKVCQLVFFLRQTKSHNDHHPPPSKKKNESETTHPHTHCVHNTAYRPRLQSKKRVGKKENISQ